MTSQGKPIKLIELPSGEFRVATFVKGKAFVRDFPTYDDAVGAAHMIGRYKLGLGDLLFTYVDGLRQEA